MEVCELCHQWWGNIMVLVMVLADYLKWLEFVNTVWLIWLWGCDIILSKIPTIFHIYVRWLCLKIVFRIHIGGWFERLVSVWLDHWKTSIEINSKILLNRHDFTISLPPKGGGGGAGEQKYYYTFNQWELLQVFQHLLLKCLSFIYKSNITSKL